MKAIVQESYGEPAEVLHLSELTVPSDDDVVIAVRAAGVNWADYSITTGLPYMVRLVAVFLVLFNIVGLPYPGAYDNLLIAVSFVFNGLIVWYAWTW
ncbi:MAG: hypothetical protein WCE80_09305 [Acidimicrobiia bacterium]